MSSEVAVLVSIGCGVVWGVILHGWIVRAELIRAKDGEWR